MKETVANIDVFGVWTIRDGEDRPHLRYVPIEAEEDIRIFRPPYRYESSQHGPAAIYDAVGVGWIARVKESLPHKEAIARVIVQALNEAANVSAPGVTDPPRDATDTAEGNGADTGAEAKDALGKFLVAVHALGAHFRDMLDQRMKLREEAKGRTTTAAKEKFSWYSAQVHVLYDVIDDFRTFLKRDA